MCRGQQDGVHPTRRLASCLFSTRRRVGSMPSRFLHFSSTGRCAPCTPPRFHSFTLLGDQQGSVHPTRCLVIFLFSLMWRNLPPFRLVSPPPLLGDSYFSVAVSSTGGGACSTHPLSLCLPPIYWGDFFLRQRQQGGAVYDMYAAPSYFVYPPLMGGIILLAGIVV